MRSYWQSLSRSERGGWRSDLLLLLGTCLLILLPGLGQTNYLASREIRHAEIIREMAESRQYLVPRLIGQTYFDKPSLMHAPAAWLTRLWGRPSLALARLPSAVYAILTILAVYVLGRNLHGRLVGICAATALLAMPGFHSMARQARPDMILAFSVVASSLTALMGMRCERANSRLGVFALSGLLAGAGTLAKGPFGLLFPLFFCLIIPFRDQRWKPMRWGFVAWILGLLVALLAWAIPAYWHDHGAYLRGVLQQPDLEGGTSTSRNLLKQLTYYPRNGIVSALPAVLFLPLVFSRRNQELPPRSLGLAAAIFAVLTAIPKQRKHYLLPALPFLAIGLMPQIIESSSKHPWIRRAAFILFPVFLFGQGLFYSIGLPLFRPGLDPEVAFSRQVLEKVEAKGIILCMEGHEALAWTARSHMNIRPIGEDGDPLAALAKLSPEQPAYLIADERNWARLTAKATLPHEELCRVKLSDSTRLLLRIHQLKS